MKKLKKLHKTLVSESDKEKDKLKQIKRNWDYGFQTKEQI